MMMRVWVGRLQRRRRRRGCEGFVASVQSKVEKVIHHETRTWVQTSFHSFLEREIECRPVEPRKSTGLPTKDPWFYLAMSRSSKRSSELCPCLTRPTRVGLLISSISSDVATCVVGVILMVWVNLDRCFTGWVTNQFVEEGERELEILGLSGGRPRRGCRPPVKRNH